MPNKRIGTRDTNRIKQRTRPLMSYLPHRVDQVQQLPRKDDVPRGMFLCPKDL